MRRCYPLVSFVPRGPQVLQPSQLFAVVSAAVLPAWALLLFLPRWRFTRALTAYAVPSLISLVYLAVMLSRVDPLGMGFTSLDQIGHLYQDPWVLLAAWAHYLALDLFTGAWMVRDSMRLKIRHAFVVPCLFLTFLAGPIGLLAYFAVRAALVRRLPSTAPLPTGEFMVSLARGRERAGDEPVRPRAQPPPSA